jgi:uncharacterized iron-regulated membrane protein
MFGYFVLAVEVFEDVKANLTLKNLSSKVNERQYNHLKPTGERKYFIMHGRSLVTALASTLLAGYVLAAVPNHATISGNAADQVQQARPNPEVLAQQQAGLEAQEQQLLNQIQADDAKLKADAAAEAAQQRRANPQIRFIRASLNFVSEAAGQLQHTTKHYSGHRAEALRAMLAAHRQLMQCYQIDSQM